MQIRTIAIEEDGDEIFVPLSVGCLKYECQWWETGAERPSHPKLIIEDDHWICPNCRASYGDFKP